MKKINKNLIIDSILIIAIIVSIFMITIMEVKYLNYSIHNSDISLLERYTDMNIHKAETWHTITNCLYNFLILIIIILLTKILHKFNYNKVLLTISILCSIGYIYALCTYSLGDKSTNILMFSYILVYPVMCLGGFLDLKLSKK